jgi:murein DD-endopeptidase MepM/ murein hydrolase activator NlpD
LPVITFAIGMSAVFGPLLLPGAMHPVVQIAAPLPAAELAAQVAAQKAALEAQPATYVREETLQPGETIGALLRRMSIDDRDASRFIRANTTARELFQLDAGERIRATIDSDRRLVALHSMLTSGRGGISRLTIARAGERRFRATRQKAGADVEWAMRFGPLGRNSFASMRNAGVPASVIAQIAGIFSPTLDLQNDLRHGDRFQVVFERLQRDQGTIEFGRVLAVELVSRGRPYQAIWFAASGEAGQYYNFAGKPRVQGTFRPPLALTRVSSGFGGRKHPLSQDWRDHSGVDFPAPQGTQVFAAAPGTVEFAGVQRGYGNVVVVSHANAYSTYYAHLSSIARGIRTGGRVASDQVLGLVGQTGWATGPHLHFELRYRNRPIDPLRTVQSGAPALRGAELRAFERSSTSLLERMTLLRSVQGGPIDA